jgi:hypothetical protein
MCSRFSHDALCLPNFLFSLLFLFAIAKKLAKSWFGKHEPLHIYVKAHFRKNIEISLIIWYAYLGFLLCQ